MTWYAAPTVSWFGYVSTWGTPRSRSRGRAAGERIAPEDVAAAGHGEADTDARPHRPELLGQGEAVRDVERGRKGRLGHVAFPPQGGIGPGGAQVDQAHVGRDVEPVEFGQRGRRLVRGGSAVLRGHRRPDHGQVARVDVGNDVPAGEGACRDEKDREKEVSHGRHP